MSLRLHIRVYALEAKQTLVLAGPIIFGQMGQIVLQMTDNMMVGQLGTIPLAAASFADSLVAIFLVFGLGVLSGLSPLVAHAYGANQERQCGEILRHGVLLAAILGLLSFAVILLGLPLLTRMGQTAEVVSAAEPFFLLIMASLIPAFIFQIFKQFSESLGHPVVPMAMTFIGIALNIALNYVLIYGHFGFPALGLAGSGLATLTVRLLMAAALVVVILRHRSFIDFLPETWRKKWQGTEIRKLLKIGIPSGLQYIFEIGAFAFVAIMAGWISPESQAAHQVAISVAALTFMIAIGLSIAASVRVGYAMGRADIIAARRIGFGAILMGATMMGVAGIAFIVFRHEIPWFFIKEREVVEIATQLLLVGAIFQIFDGTQGVAVGVLRGLQDVRVPTILTFFVYWAVAVPLAYFLGFTREGGVVGLWWALTLGLVLSAISLSLRFHFKTQGTSGTPQHVR